MSQESPGKIVSFQAAESITAKRVVGFDSSRQARMWDTNTTHILGVSADFGESSGSVPVVVSGTVRVTCNASVSAGALVGPATDSGGKIMERSANTTTVQKILGLALESGSSNSSIEVLLQISNKTLGI